MFCTSHIMAGNQSCRHEFTDDQKVTSDTISWMFECVGTLFVAPVGIIFNGLALYLLLSTKLSESFFNRLLAFMATFDILYLTLSITEAIRQHLIPSCLHDYIFVIFVYPVRSISIYTTLALALERFVNVCKPVSNLRKHGGGHDNNWRRVVKYVVPIMTFSTLFYIPKFLELKTVDCEEQCSNMESNNKTNCTTKRINITDLRRDEDYVLWYINVSNFVFTCAIPFITLTYLNSRIYLRLRQYLHRSRSRVKHMREERPKDVHQAIVLFSIVILFFVCHVFRALLNVVEFTNLDERLQGANHGCTLIRFWVRITYPICHFLLKLNASVNFFIYIAFDKTFRKMMRSTFPSLFEATSRRCNTENIKETSRYKLPCLKKDNTENIREKETEFLEMKNLNK